MDLYFEIKSRFQKATIIEMNVESTTFEIIFEDAVDSVFVKLENEDRFIVSYPILQQDYKGNLKLSSQTSSNVLLTGLLWILDQVKKNGQVMPKFL